jgi:glycine/D-amino acid oxidase-like deaminating enzyme
MIGREVDVVVIGAGIVGCATAYYLARRGVRVAVVERAGVAGEQSRKNFAMGPVAGRLVSELIVDGKTSLDVSAFRFSRFAEGAIGRPRNVL